MDALKLKLHGELLEREIQANLGKSKDVDWLAQYPPLLEAIKDAKDCRIDQLRDLGLARWEMESSIQDFDELSERLAQFGLLLWGWDRLPSEGGP
jgi:hypothetical protein